jgi:hypothetical protein
MEEDCNGGSFRENMEMLEMELRKRGGHDSDPVLVSSP